MITYVNENLESSDDSKSWGLRRLKSWGLRPRFHLNATLMADLWIRLTFADSFEFKRCQLKFPRCQSADRPTHVSSTSRINYVNLIPNQHGFEDSGVTCSWHAALSLRTKTSMCRDLLWSLRDTFFALVFAQFKYWTKPDLLWRLFGVLLSVYIGCTLTLLADTWRHGLWCSMRCCAHEHRYVFTKMLSI